MNFIIFLTLVAMAQAGVVEIKTGGTMVLTISNYISSQWGCNMRVTCTCKNIKHVAVVKCSTLTPMCSVDRGNHPLVADNATMIITARGKEIGCKYTDTMTVHGKLVNATHVSTPYHHNDCMVDKRPTDVSGKYCI